MISLSTGKTQVTTVLDLKLIRQNPDQVAAALAKRSGDYAQSLSEIQTLDSEQRELEGARSQLQARSNEIGKADRWSFPFGKRGSSSTVTRCSGTI